MSTSLQAPAGATECLNPELDSALCVLAACSQQGRTGELPGLSPGITRPNILGKPRWSPQGQQVPVGGTKGGGTGQGGVVVRVTQTELPPCLQQ